MRRPGPVVKEDAVNSKQKGGWEMLKTLMAVDGSNVVGQAKSVNRKADFLRLREFLASPEEGRFLVEGIVYLPVPPNGNSERVVGFHNFLRSNGFMVVSKNGVPRPDGSFKANMDTDLVLDVMEMALTIRPDIVVLVTGDGDFSGLCVRLRRRGIRVEVASIQEALANSLRRAATSVVDLKPYFNACEPLNGHAPVLGTDDIFEQEGGIHA